MQIVLSQILFTDSKYAYLFASTHSPFVLYEMDNVNLIRIYNEGKIDSASTFYKVPAGFEKNRKMLNRSLSEAIFANNVILVEGPSEVLLFEKVLSTINPFFGADGIYVLSVVGIAFETYFKLLDNLNIFNVIKTDNDLRGVTGKGTYSVLGFSRCNNYALANLIQVFCVARNQGHRTLFVVFVWASFLEPGLCGVALIFRYMFYSSKYSGCKFILSSSVIERRTRQGEPTARLYGGISLVTTEPAPITHPSPMLTLGQMVTLPPSQQLSPMVTEPARSKFVVLPVFSLKKALRS